MWRFVATSFPVKTFHTCQTLLLPWKISSLLSLLKELSKTAPFKYL